MFGKGLMRDIEFFGEFVQIDLTRDRIEAMALRAPSICEQLYTPLLWTDFRILVSPIGISGGELWSEPKQDLNNLSIGANQSDRGGVTCAVERPIINPKMMALSSAMSTIGP